MGVCAVHDCKNDSEKKLTPDSSFHQFPRDANLRTMWTNFCKTTIVRTSRICNLHFKREDIENDFKYQMGFASLRKLVPGAVPTIQTKDFQLDSKSEHSQLDYWKPNKKNDFILQGQQEENTTSSFEPIHYDMHESNENYGDMIEIDGNIFIKKEIDEVAITFTNSVDPSTHETPESNNNSLNMIANDEGFFIKEEIFEESTKYTNNIEPTAYEKPDEEFCIKEEIIEDYLEDTNSTYPNYNTEGESDKETSHNELEQESRAAMTSRINSLNEEISHVQSENVKLLSSVMSLAKRNKALNLQLKRRFYEISNLKSVLLLSYTEDQVERIKKGAKID